MHNAEATGSNPVEAPKIFFSGYFRNCSNCDSLRWSHTHFTKIVVVLFLNELKQSISYQLLFTSEGNCYKTMN